MHLLVDATVKGTQIEEQLRKVGVAHAEIHQSVLGSKTCLSSFPPNTLRNDKRPRDRPNNVKMKHKPFRGFTAILFKEFIVVWRDPLTLFFFFFPPLIEMVAFGYALDNDVKHMAMLVLNEDRTVESRQLIDQFVNTQSFSRSRRSAKPGAVEERNAKGNGVHPRFTSRRTAN